MGHQHFVYNEVSESRIWYLYVTTQYFSILCIEQVSTKFVCLNGMIHNHITASKSASP